MNELHDYFMEQAIKEAKKAYVRDEVPIGAIIVKDKKIISKGYNHRDKQKKITKHAELIAIERANKKLGDWRLNDCIMYITNEPCPMCSGAIQQSRISDIYVGSLSTKNHKLAKKILNNKELNHIVKIHYNVKKEECEKMLNIFFKEKRNKKDVSRET